MSLREEISERDYCRVGNLKSVRIMQEIVRNMDVGDDEGFTEAQQKRIATLLGVVSDRLEKLISDDS